MTDVILEREFDEPITTDDFAGMLEAGVGCLQLHQVSWLESFLSVDGKTLVCHYAAPDMESARIAMRQMVGEEYKAVWPASVHDVATDKLMNVAVERTFSESVLLDDIQAIENAGQACLDLHNVSFVRTLFSTDRKRMICLYNAPDAESVRIAQMTAKMPFDRVWACQRIAD